MEYDVEILFDSNVHIASAFEDTEAIYIWI